MANLVSRLSKLAFLVVLCPLSAANGDLIHSTAHADSYSVTAITDEAPDSGFQDSNDSGDNAYASAFSSASGAQSSVSGFAIADARFTQGTFALSTDAYLSWSGTDPYSSPYGQSKAVATWTDVLYLAMADPSLSWPYPIGQTLRLNFESVLGFTDSTIGNGGPGYLPEISITLEAKGTHVGNPSASDFATTTATVFSTGGNTQTAGFDQIAAGGKYLWHLDIPLTGDGYGYVPGSVLYSISLTDFIDGYAGSGSVHAWDPTKFVSITLPDVGNVTPESLGVTLTFDSGIRSPNVGIGAVPEPTSLALLGTGAIGILIAAGRRRRVAGASTDTDRTPNS